MNIPEISRRTPSSRVGLFGGTFNPIHKGHVQVALDVLASACLDRIYFVPSAIPPHKSTGRLASAQDRLAMVAMALDDHPHLKVCEAEIKRSGPSYSIDTVRQCKAALPPGGHLFFILGADAFLEIDAWKAYDQLFDETAFIVVSRPGSGQWSHAMRETVAVFVGERIDAAYRLVPKNGDTLVHPHKQAIHLLAVTAVDIASSQIRAMLRQGRAVDNWVSPPVARYIRNRGLYR